MRWFKPILRNSMSALLRPEVRKGATGSLEPVREAMLEALGEDGVKANPQLTRKLKYLHDAQALWFARAEMVAVLSELHGEALAVHRVHSLSPVFQGLVSKSLMDASRVRR